MRLLLAEDDRTLGRAVALHFLRQGHLVDWVTNGNQLLRLMQDQTYDCVMLDLGLPELSGQDCLVNLRMHNDTTPVIVTTAQGFRESRIRLLELGADDYLLKPFDLRELSARIVAIIRRSTTQTRVHEEGTAFGPFVLMPSAKCVVRDGERIALTATEYAVLEVLLQNRTSVVSRQQLEAGCLGWTESNGSNAIELHIHNLRRKLGAAVIRTVRGMGYQLQVPAPAAPQRRQPSSEGRPSIAGPL
jgi:DNA-binding response OmpR family regulator